MALCLRLLIFAFESKEQQWYYYAFLKTLQANSGRLWEATLNISVVPREKTFCNFEAKEDFWKGSYSQLKTLSGAWRAEGSLWWGCNWACPGKTGPSWGRETAQTARWACWSREELRHRLGRCSYFPLVLAVGLDIFKGGEVIMTRKIGQIWTKWDSGHLFPNRDALKYSRSKEPRIPTWGRYPGFVPGQTQWNLLSPSSFLAVGSLGSALVAKCPRSHSVEHLFLGQPSHSLFFPPCRFPGMLV